jgi:ribonucleotide monophosphatase NagD (HAD superfamily)
VTVWIPDIIAGIEAGLHTILAFTGISNQSEIDKYPFPSDEVLEQRRRSARAGADRVRR